MKPVKKLLVEQLKAKYNVRKGKRWYYSPKRIWYFPINERLAAILIETYLKEARVSVTISELYNLRELRIMYPNNELRQAIVKYVIAVYLLFNLIHAKCNNGFRIISWNFKAKLRKHSHKQYHKPN